MEESVVTRIEGSPAEIGEALGRLARPVMPALLANSSTWAQLQPWRGHQRLDAMMGMTRDMLPECWDELQGMAQGIGMDAADLFLWNCRADLQGHGPDESSCVAVHRLANSMIAQKVANDLRPEGHCRIVDVQPHNRPGFLALYCPGTLPGHAFAANRRGLVQAVNLLDVPEPAEGVPSMMLCRALLGAATFADALDLMELPRAGAAHHLLGWAGEFIMLSIEATPGTRSVEPVVRGYGHANHLVHREAQPDAQTITPSSRKRQGRMAELLKTLPDFPEERELLDLLDATDEGASGAVPQAQTSAVFRFTPAEIHVHLRHWRGTEQLLIQVGHNTVATSRGDGS
ncbi:C45 family autoproteolytic acyltransferase/hydolase [Noviherbaspirillum massiliense]|uniref:C45 family autoproteolytic acyltransferase/hydolase n=1 Tax=Noviherbaspirillum massiliense TaxID=1465823 RepID=UPI000366697C|nr:C45 family peptidase [Noviherbaspirillum massiliense]